MAIINRGITNDIYPNTWAVGLEIDSIQKQTLFSIAMLTPYIGGEGVYSARAMLGIDPEDYNLPYRKGSIDDMVLDSENQISVYPNPTMNTIIIDSDHKLENAELIIYDVVGHEVMNKMVEGKTIKVNLIPLKTGVYFYMLKSSNYATYFGKIIKH